MKRKIGLISSLLAFTLIAVGCGDNNNGNDGDSENNGNNNEAAAENGEANEGESTSLGSDEAEVEMDFWLFGATGYPELAKEYIEENPNVSINFQEIEMGDHHNNLFTALSAGSGAPDMAAIEVSEIDGYKDAQDRFVNLYDLGADEIKGDFLDWTWKNGESVDGDFLFGIPTDIGPTTMFYRADVFEEAGLPSEPEEVEALISTWDDYNEVAKTILEETGKPMAENPETVFNAKRDQAPEAYFNEEDELILESSPYVEESFFQTSEMIENGYIENFGMWTPEWGAGMADGSFATLLAPAWMQGVIKGNAPDATEWRVAAMPEGGGNWGGSYVTIPAESEYAEEAYEFLTWLLAPEQQLKAFQNMGLFPSAPAVYDMPEFKDYTDEYFGGQNTAQVFADSALEGEHIHKGPKYGDVNTEILAGLNNVYDGIDPEEEWEDVLNRVEQRINR